MTLHTPQNSLTAKRSAAQVLVDQLVIQGVEHVFCVPGESFLGVLDALRDSPVTLTVCRQEGGAAMMAEAVGKATGRPGVCFVTRGPGAANALAGVHVAKQDSTPMILFVGQVERANKDREAFQEMDYRAVFGSQTKWTAEIERPERMAEYTARAFHIAMSGRPGPVVLSLPRDMLNETVAVRDVPRSEALETSPGAADMAALEKLLAGAQQPIFVLGGSGWNAQACAAMARFAEKFAVPVATSYRRAPLFDALHPNYAGDVGIGPNPKLLARVKQSDLTVVAGARISEIMSQNYTLFREAHTRLVHVHPGAEEIGKVYAPHLGIQASPRCFAAALEALTPEHAGWAADVKAAHDDYLEWSGTPTSQPGNVNLGAIMVWLRENLPRETIICNGAGNYAAWIHRFFRFREFAGHIAPTSASMGYGVPAAIAMQRLYPGRKIISINGDGDFLMNGQEFATAVQYDLPIIVLVFDNASYGTIRMHQEREYPGRVSGTDLRNPDFAAYARAFGGFGTIVEKTADFEAAFRAAEASKQPAIIHVKFDAEGITPTTTLSRLRERK